MMRQPIKSPTLGILQLAHAPLEFPGTLGNPRTFAYPVEYLQVGSAWLDAVISVDRSAGDGFIAGAQHLAERGVAVIITNCGLTSVFQDRLANAVSVPVATSSLLQLPFLHALLPREKRIGILTYDSNRLGEGVLRAAGYHGDLTEMAIAGIEGTDAWGELARPTPCVEPGSLESDLLNIAATMLDREQNVGALLLECAAFCPFAGKLRLTTELPVLDIVTLADHLMASVAATSTRVSAVEVSRSSIYQDKA